jgi:F-type H+-transporting ATPase subunit b
LTVLIDWFSVGAQVINFLILVVLLKRFLYGPIIRVMSEREQRIASQLDHARQMKQEAEWEAETYRQKAKEIDDSWRERSEQVDREVETWRQEKLTEARVEVEETQHRWYQAIQQDQEALVSQLRHRTVEQVLAISRRALADLANSELERQIIARFIELIRQPDGEASLALKELIQKPGEAIVVRSSFELSPEVRRNIQEVIDKQIDTGRVVSFETSPQVICGIELRVSGHKIAWSLDTYLGTLGDGVSGIFQERDSEGTWT